MTTSMMLLVIVGCALVTWIPRVLPFILVKNMEMPQIILRWLSYIPICILSALVLENILYKETTFVHVDMMQLIVLMPTLLTALLTKSLAKTVIVGVIAMAIVRNILL